AGPSVSRETVAETHENSKRISLPEEASEQRPNVSKPDRKNGGVTNVNSEMNRKGKIKSNRISVEELYALKSSKSTENSKELVKGESTEELESSHETRKKRKRSVKTTEKKSQKKVREADDINVDGEFQASSGKKIEERETSEESEIDEESESEGKDTSDEKEVIQVGESTSSEETKKSDDLERLQRTIFVGNLSTSVIEKKNHKKLRSYFSSCGRIESIRFRSIAFSRQLPRKVAFINKKLHPERDSLNAYIVFKEKASVQKALSKNGEIFMGKHLRVDSAVKSQSYDRKRSVFIGNLNFDAQDEALWSHFENCGEIAHVRIVRDGKTNVGKGIAYVQFKDRSSVELALKLNNTKIGTRSIRVSRCHKSSSDGRIQDKEKPSVGKVVKRSFE
ncbi:7334_t:CDS:2, partial [Acaulospora morrowiae]